MLYRRLRGIGRPGTDWRQYAGRFPFSVEGGAKTGSKSIRARIRKALLFLAGCLALCSCASGQPLLNKSASTAITPFQRIEYASQAIDSEDLDALELSMAYNNRCWGWMDLGRSQQALDDCNRALSLNPNNFFVYINRSMVWHQMGEPERTIEDARRALDAAPNNPMAWVNLAQGLNDLHRYDESLNACRQAIKIDSSNASAYIVRSHALYETGMILEAFYDLERALSLAPLNALANNSFAFFLATAEDASLKDPERAVVLAEKAVELRPDDPMFLDTLAMSYGAASRWEEATAIQEKAIRLLLKDDFIRERNRLGDYQEHLRLLQQGRLKSEKNP